MVLRDNVRPMRNSRLIDVFYVQISFFIQPEVVLRISQRISYDCAPLKRKSYDAIMFNVIIKRICYMTLFSAFQNPYPRERQAILQGITQDKNRMKSSPVLPVVAYRLLRDLRGSFISKT